MNLHLTRALIPYELAARWESGGRPGFADPYAWHQRAWEAFPHLHDCHPAKRGAYPKGISPEEQQRINRENPPPFLSRVDPKDRDLQLLLLSSSSPVRPNWCPEDQWQSKTIDESFFSHPRYRFSLLANPTRKVRLNAKGERLKNSRRVPITHREDRKDRSSGAMHSGLVSWLVAHGKEAGFTIDDSTLRSITRPRQAFVRPPKERSPSRPVTLHCVDFQGTLAVTNPILLRQAFTSGIGSAKAFGFGMLCLSPA